MNVFVGIDPGVSGGIAVIQDGGGNVSLHAIKSMTERELARFIYDVEGDFHVGFAVIERVHSSPQMGVKSAFTFGQSYGFLRGTLAASGMMFDEVLPRAWQKELGCLTKGNKNVTKAKAQQLFPGVKVKHATADALLLAEYARRIWNQRYGGAA